MAQTDTMLCPRCGATMNRHAQKLDRSAAFDAEDATDLDAEGDLIEIFACPRCGAVASRKATEMREKDGDERTSEARGGA